MDNPALLAAERQIETLEVIGRAMRNGQLVSMDEDVIDAAYAHATDTYAEKPGVYARHRIVEVRRNHEGLNLLFATGGTRITAQHIADEDQWHVEAKDGSHTASVTLQPSEIDHADALIALEWLRGDCADQIETP